MRNEPIRRSVAAMIAAFLFLGSLFSSALATQEIAGDVAGLFGEVIDVRLVNLEVVVTGPDGRRVYGLRPDDFVLYVDRRPVPIGYFTEVRAGAAVASAEETANEETANEETANEPGISAVPSLEPGGAVSTNYLVFIDEYFAVGHDRDRAVDDLITQLSLLGAADRMAVLAWNGGKLEMLSNWSRSASDLRRALTAAKGRPTSGLQRELELRQHRRGSRIDRGPDRQGDRVPYDIPDHEPFRDPYRDRVHDPDRDPENVLRVRRLSERVERLMRAATTAMRGFARPAGRKAMLLLAGGWPYNPWDAVVPDPFGPSHFSGTLDYGPRLYQQLYDTANRLGYTLYPVGVRGFGVGAGASAVHPSPAEARYRWRLASDRGWSEHSTLTLLAHQTGGRTVLNRDRRTALEQVVSDTRSYYWLGFTPTRHGIDRRHRVEIQARDPELAVRSRRSFSDLSRRTEVDMIVESALLFGDPPGPRTLAAKLGKTRAAGFHKIEVPLAVAFPMGALTFLPTPDGWSAEAELRVAVEDQHGDRVEVASVPLDLTTASEPEQGAVGRCATTVKLRRLRHDMVVSIHDPLSGRILWTRLTFDPGDGHRHQAKRP